MIRTIALAAFGALALNGSLPASAATDHYDAAASYVAQFPATKIHLETQDDSIANPAQDYIDAARGTFRAQKRQGGEVMNYDASQTFINRMN